jgi:hypothetical protein
MVALQAQLDVANETVAKLMNYNDELEQELESAGRISKAAAVAALDPQAAATTPTLASAPLGGGLALPAASFPIGSMVYVKRSNKTETIAFVKEYDAGTNVYTLQLAGDDSGKTKQCLEKAMRAAPVEDGHAAAADALDPPQKRPAAGGLAAGSSSGADASPAPTPAPAPAPAPAPPLPPPPPPPTTTPVVLSDAPPPPKKKAKKSDDGQATSALAAGSSSLAAPADSTGDATRPLRNPAQAAKHPKSPRLAASAHPVKCYFHGLELTTGEFHCHRPQMAANMRLCSAPNCMEGQSKCSAASFHYQCYFDYYTEKMIDLSSDWNPFRCPACDDPVQ